MITLYQEGYFPYKYIGEWGEEYSGKLKAESYLRDVEINDEGLNPASSSPEHPMRAIDYMLLGTVRDQINISWDCEPETDVKGCGTWPKGIASIMDAFELTLTKNKYWTNERKSDYNDIVTAMSAGKGVILFVNGSFESSQTLKKQDGPGEDKNVTGRFGIHYIVLKSFNVVYANDGSISSVSGSYWDYGQTDPTRFKTFNFTKDQFETPLKGIFITNQ
jgi:hypothetical protein